MQRERLAARGEQRQPGAASRSSPMNGAAPIRCSQLSGTSSRCLAAGSARPPPRRLAVEHDDPKARTIAAGTSSGASTAASATNAPRRRSPPRRRARSRARAASCRLRRGPSAYSRTAPAQPLAKIAASSCSRPIVRFGGDRQRAVRSRVRHAHGRRVEPRVLREDRLWRACSSGPGSIPSCSMSTSRACR